MISYEAWKEKEGERLGGSGSDWMGTEEKKTGWNKEVKAWVLVLLCLFHVSWKEHAKWNREPHIPLFLSRSRTRIEQATLQKN